MCLLRNSAEKGQVVEEAVLDHFPKALDSMRSQFRPQLYGDLRVADSHCRVADDHWVCCPRTDTECPSARDGGAWKYSEGSGLVSGAVCQKGGALGLIIFH